MLKKLNNKKGFTLMEMLIVVAIIAVLVAIAIPVFNGALTKSKEAADVANIRAAYADWQVAIITGEKSATDIKDVDTFLKGASGNETYPVTYKASDKDTHGLSYSNNVITYNATKLTGGNGTGDNADHIFTWTMTEATFNDATTGG